MTTGSEYYTSLSREKTAGNYEKSRWDTPLGRGHFATTERAIRAHALPLAHGMQRYVEVGPGPGTWTKLFRGEYPKVQCTLVDISAEMLAQAKVALGEENTEFVHSDFLAFNGSNSFDFFFSSRALEYFENKDAYVQKAAALLKSGGHGFVVTKCGHPIRDMMRGRTLPERHRHQTTPRALARILAAEGLRVTGWGPAAVTVPLISNSGINTAVFNFLTVLPSWLVPTLFLESFWISFEKL